MKIIHTVESYLPEHHGMSEVVRQISEQLVKLGHEVIICTSFNSDRDVDSINGVIIKQFKISGNLVDGISGEKSEYQNYLLNETFDVLTNFAAQQWATDLTFEILDKIKSKKFFVPTGFSRIDEIRFKDYYNKMPHWLKLYDNNIFLSKFYKDFEFAKINDVNNSVIIPNGASLMEFTSSINFDVREFLKLSSNDKIILHVGNFTGIKGHFEAFRIFKKAKIRNAHLILCGQNFNSPESFNFRLLINPINCFFDKRILHPRNFFKACLNLFISKKNIHLLSLSREKLVDVYRQASVVLLPSKLECSPIVLFESIASKVPILISDVGNAREIVEKFNVGFILPTKNIKNGLLDVKIEESALLLNYTLSDKNILRIKSENGYNAWFNNFTWEKITNQYEKLYHKAFNEK